MKSVISVFCAIKEYVSKWSYVRKYRFRIRQNIKTMNKFQHISNQKWSISLAWAK